MDKYEFNIKVEQIKKLVNKKDYATAMKIADTIDWRRVRSANLLSMVAEVYENNEEYQEAKEILLLAFERAPIGKRLLYKLAELALKEGSVREAEDYYREFCELAGDDPRQYLLRYMILKAKKAPEEQLIHSLERYTDTELDEKWLYELAELYGRTGQKERCVQTCDRLMLMFGLGKYVDKAMDLKVQYAPLNSYQQDLVENRDKYEEKLRAVEQEFGADAPELGLEEYDEEDEPEEEITRETRIGVEEEDASYRTIDEELAASIHQAKAEERVAKEMSKISIEEFHEPEAPAEQTKILTDIRQIAAAYAAEEEGTADAEKTGAAAEAVKAEAAVAAEKTGTAAEAVKAEAAVAAEPVTVREEEPADIPEEESWEEDMIPEVNHLMIEARTPEKGIGLAVDMLKKAHREQGSKNQVVKITGSRLSERGVAASENKLAGKDLVIDEAGDLTEDALDELRQLLLKDRTGMNVVMVDNPRQMESLRQSNPELTSMFTFVGLEASREPEERKPEPAAPEEDLDLAEQTALKADPAAAEQAAAEEAPELYEQEEEERFYQDEAADSDEEMDLRDFVEYASKYASDIDCSITGKSMLALYERIEIMEEDGIPLTRANAEDLIEEAADKAEKFSVKKIFTGMFSPKYDKEGLLILREDHFMD